MKEILKNEIDSLNMSYLLEIVGHKNQFTYCSYCRIRVSRENSSMDHVVPNWLVRKYVDCKREKIYFNRINKIPCCRSCNLAKGGYTLRQWREVLLKNPYAARNLIILKQIRNILKY